MSKKDDIYSGLSKQEREELQKVLEEITKEAKRVVEDYTINPSEMSGSVIQVHEDSPFLDEKIKGDTWKKIGDVIEDVMKDLKDKQGEDDDK